jgi:hypothetical protein
MVAAEYLTVCHSGFMGKKCAMIGNYGAAGPGAMQQLAFSNTAKGESRKEVFAKDEGHVVKSFY